MHQTGKGKQWYFGMKAHIGVDLESGLTHGLATTAANGSDVTHAHLVLHGGETDAWGDAGYQGVEKRPENRDREVDWHVAMKPQAAAARQGEHRRGDREAQDVVAGEGGASVPVCEVPLRLFQGALSGLGKEHATHRDAARLREPAHRRSVRGHLTWEWCLSKPPRAARTSRETLFSHQIGAKTRFRPKPARSSTTTRPIAAVVQTFPSPSLPT